MHVLKPAGTLAAAVLLAASVWMTARTPVPAIPADGAEPVIEHVHLQEIDAQASDGEDCSMVGAKQTRTTNKKERAGSA